MADEEKLQMAAEAIEEEKIDVAEAVLKQAKLIPEDRRYTKSKVCVGRCANCGTITDSESKYCSECGQKLDWPEEKDEGKEIPEPDKMADN